MLPGPPHVVAPLKFKVRPSSATAVTALGLIANDPFTFNVPGPCTVPELLQLKRPLTLMVSLPPSIPLLIFTVPRLIGPPELKLTVPLTLRLVPTLTTLLPGRKASVPPLATVLPLTL